MYSSKEDKTYLNIPRMKVTLDNFMNVNAKSGSSIISHSLSFQHSCSDQLFSGWRTLFCLIISGSKPEPHRWFMVISSHTLWFSWMESAQRCTLELKMNNVMFSLTQICFEADLPNQFLKSYCNHTVLQCELQKRALYIKYNRSILVLNTYIYTFQSIFLCCSTYIIQKKLQ